MHRALVHCACAALLAAWASRASAAAGGDPCLELELPAGDIAAIGRRGNPNKRSHAYERNLLMCMAASRRIPDVDKVRIATTLIERKVDFDLMDNFGNSALHLAVIGGAPELAKLLMDHGADPDTVNMLGVSPFQSAMASQDPLIVDAFNGRGRYVDNRDASGGTALFSAAQRGDLAMVRRLIARGAEATASNQSALMGAVMSEQLEIVRYLIDEAGLPIDLRSKDGETSLMGAAAANRLAMVRLLIEERGADPQLRSPTGFSALSLAASAGHLDVMRYLLAHGATNDASQPSAIAAAAVARQAAAVRLLIDSGVDLGAGVAEQPGVLYWAAMGGDEPVLEMLVASGADFPQLPDDTGPLLRAVANQHYARGLLAKERYADATPYLREAATNFGALAASLEERATTLHKSARKQQFKVDMITAFAIAFGQFASAWQARQQANTIAQMEALSYASKTGTGAQGYFDMYAQLQPKLAAAADRSEQAARIAASTPQPSPPEGSPLGLMAYRARSLVAEAQALEHAAAEYRSTSTQVAAALACAQSTAQRTAGAASQQCLQSGQ